MCYKNLAKGDGLTTYKYSKINEHEVKLLTFDHSVINWSQLFEVDVDLNDVSVTNEKVMDILKEFTRNNLVKGNLNLSDNVKAKDKFSNM